MKYCPKCRTEYENWVFSCADCNVALVFNLPPEETPESMPAVNYITIHTTPKPAEVAFIKSLFDANGIQYFMKNEDISSTIGTGYVDGYAWIEIMVAEDQAEIAKELLGDFLKRDKAEGDPESNGK